jgi:hypothetical protein
MAEVSVDPILGVVEGSCIAAAEAALGYGGFVPEPQVHMAIDDWDQPYVGYVISRPYRRGSDAVDAILGLGSAPAAIVATRVFVVWEWADLCASLDGPGDYPNGLGILAATPSGYTLHWHPLTMHIGPPQESGLPTVRAEWGTPARVANAELPAVIRGVLDRWRSLDGEPSTVFADLARAGYRVQIVDR